jgi:prepilin-type processing-associated H-X9-DG protein
MTDRTAWTAHVDFVEESNSYDIELIQGNLERGTDHISTIIPANIGSKACVRPVPKKTPRKLLGYWRGTTEDADDVTNTLCLRVVDAPDEPVEAYLSFEFFDYETGWIGVHYERDGAGFVHHVCTHDQEQTWEHAWINTANSQTWQRAVVPLTAARFTGKGPYGCDIEIQASEPLHIRSVTVSTVKPDNFDSTNLDAHAKRLCDVLGPQFAEVDVPVSVGNIGSIMEKTDINSAQDVTPWLPVYKAWGITSIQSYVRWESIEREEDVWTWGIYDWTVEQAKRFDMRWVAFIMIGPYYAMPSWWLAKNNDYRNKCLEHGEESFVQSIWSPVMLEAVDRFMKKFSDHYDHDIVESIMLGIAGDFGESTTNGVFIAGMYHTHVGHWCGEDVAIEAFRSEMGAKYGNIDALNAAWGSSHSAFTGLVPVEREQAISDRSWLDQMDWYIDRMTWWMEQWGIITADALPNTVIYNAAGGAGDPPRAASWSAQSKALKPTGVGHRATNEGSDYAFNFAYTSWIGTSCRFYGIPFGNEPWGGDMSGAGVLGRMFNALTMNATNYWFYDGHVRPPSGRLALQRALPFLNGKYQRYNRVAVYYPFTHFKLKDEHGFSEKGRRDIYWPQIEELRDIVDFDLVDEVLIEDGILDDYDYVIVVQGVTYEADELERLAKWVEDGGVLITHNLGVPATVEGDLTVGAKLLCGATLDPVLGAQVAKVGKGCTVVHPQRADWRGWRRDERWKDDHPDHPATNPAFWQTVTATLANASSLGVGLDDYPVIDGALDEVFAALCDHELDDGTSERGVLYFSQVQEDVTVHTVLPGNSAGETVVPAGQLVFVPLADLS